MTTNELDSQPYIYALESCSSKPCLIQAMIEDILYMNSKLAFDVILKLEKSCKLEKKQEIVLGIVQALQNYQYNNLDIPKEIYGFMCRYLENELKCGSATILEFQLFFRYVIYFLSGSRHLDEILFLIRIHKNVPINYIPLIQVALARMMLYIVVSIPNEKYRIDTAIKDIEYYYHLSDLTPLESDLVEIHLQRLREIVCKSNIHGKSKKWRLWDKPRIILCELFRKFHLRDNLMGLTPKNENNKWIMFSLLLTIVLMIFVFAVTAYVGYYRYGFIMALLVGVPLFIFLLLLNPINWYRRMANCIILYYISTGTLKITGMVFAHTKYGDFSVQVKDISNNWHIYIILGVVLIIMLIIDWNLRRESKK